MSSLKNKLSLKTFGLVYPFKYDFKCHYNTIAPGSPYIVNLPFLLPKSRHDGSLLHRSSE